MRKLLNVLSNYQSSIYAWICQALFAGAFLEGPDGGNPVLELRRRMHVLDSRLRGNDAIGVFFHRIGKDGLTIGNAETWDHRAEIKLGCEQRSSAYLSRSRRFRKADRSGLTAIAAFQGGVFSRM